MQLCRVSVLELVVSVLKDIGSDVRRVPTSEPVEISVDGVLVVSLLHERRVLGLGLGLVEPRLLYR